MIPIVVVTTLCWLTIGVALIWSLRAALLWVYLPILMWVPLYLRVPLHGVYIDSASMAGTALALMALFIYGRSWRLSTTDVFVGLYILSAFWADAHYRPTIIGEYSMIATFWAAGFPYIIGRLLIEQTRSREAVAKLVVISLAILAVVSIPEFRLTYNPFQKTVIRLSHLNIGWASQRRWGFARIAGPYGHAITAGMIFTIGVMLQTWLTARSAGVLPQPLPKDKPGCRKARRLSPFWSFSAYS